MSDLKNDFYSAAARWLQEKLPDETVLKVTSFYDSSYNAGGCSTCSYTVHEVEITYNTDKQTLRLYTYNGTFGDLLEELLDA